MDPDEPRSETDILGVRMNIDQRLDELAERQTMLHRSVERLADDLRKAFERREVVFAECEATLTENQVLLSHIHESIGSAERIANARKQRITDLGDRRQ